MKEKFNCILFDGKDLINNAIVIIEEGIVSSIEYSKENNNPNYFIMPSLIDAHTHMTNLDQVHKMMQYGIGGTFDVSASPSLIDKALDFNIVSSINMAMGMVLNPKKFVESTMEKGAKYIKVLLFNSFLIGKRALKEIVKEAHKRNLKVVVHATEIATYKQSVDCDVDIILHLPMKDELTYDLAKLIASKGIYVVPTLGMMEIFAKSGRNGYKEEHYLNAEKQIKTLYKNGVELLVGTDANIGAFAPEVSYGDSLYHEIELLLKAGLPLIDILKGVTSKIGQAFNITDIGKVEVGKKANMVLFNLENNNINVSYDNINKIWINGKEIR